MSSPVRRPERLPTAMAATTKASQIAIARHGWVALQRARRTVTGRRWASEELDTSVPFDSRFVDVVHARRAPWPTQGCCAQARGGVIPTIRGRSVSEDGPVQDSLRTRLDNLWWSIV